MERQLSAAAVVILAALLALAARALLLAVVGRPARGGAILVRLVVATFWFGLAVLYALFAAHVLVFTAGPVLVGAAVTVLVLGAAIARRSRGRRSLHPDCA